MNSLCRFMILISVIVHVDYVCASHQDSSKKLILVKAFKVLQNQKYDLELSCSSSDEESLVDRSSQSKRTGLVQVVSSNNSLPQTISQRIEDLDVKVTDSSFGGNYFSSDEDRSPVHPQRQQNNWCEKSSPRSSDKNGSGNEQELLSVSRFVYPNTDQIKPYIPTSLCEIKDIEDEDL